MDDREKRQLEWQLRMAEESAQSDYPDWRGAAVPGIVGVAAGGLLGFVLCSLIKGVSCGTAVILALLCGTAVFAVAAFRPR